MLNQDDRGRTYVLERPANRCAITGRCLVGGGGGLVAIGGVKGNGERFKPPILPKKI
ncbi:hypothetical protein GF362_03925 [Candidatus Dojkabacteria bacterium]|nr:hypothetical protein [Candidatus Dojkabacteria bacterium]